MINQPTILSVENVDSNPRGSPQKTSPDPVVLVLMIWNEHKKNPQNTLSPRPAGDRSFSDCQNFIGKEILEDLTLLFMYRIVYLNGFRDIIDDD